MNAMREYVTHDEIQAVWALKERFKNRTPLRCWGCGDYKTPGKKWLAVLYTPNNPAHPSMAYALCPTCGKSPDSRVRAIHAIETKSRAIAEEHQGGRAR